MTGPTDRHPDATEDHDRLQEQARRHLWMHFTRMARDPGTEWPVIASGEGCYVTDTAGRRYLDGLSGLFTSQLGYGRRELAEVAAEQAERMHYFPVWSHAHPPAVELATRLAGLAPGDLNRVFFTVSGSESVESALKLARQFHRANGEPGRYKVLSRVGSYHGTTMGALAITGLAQFREPFEPLPSGFLKFPNCNSFRPAFPDLTGEALTGAIIASIEQQILAEGAHTVAALFVEPLQNAGGCLPPSSPTYYAKLRELCDRHGVLLVSDEVICAYGRLGTMFGCERYDFQPDMITTAKGLTSGYSPLGAVLVSDRLMEPFLADPRASFTHGITFGGHPVSCAVALENLDIFEREGVVDHVDRHRHTFRALLDGLRDIPIVGDVRGEGYFWAIELVKDQHTNARFDRHEVEPLLRGLVGPRLLELGLIGRADDRGDPVLQFAPPLVAGPAELEELVGITRKVLEEAAATVR